VTLTYVLEATLALLVLGAAAWTIGARSAFAAAVGYVSYGLLLALVWVQLAAVDVALTEAAIGSGLTGVLLLGAVATLRRTEARSTRRPGRALRVTAGVCCALISTALAVVVLTLPEVGPTLAPEAIAALPATGVGNPVTGVLMAFRAFDTLLEKVVLVLALLGVWSLAPDRCWGGHPGLKHRLQADGVLPFLARTLPPLGVLLGIHLMWTGADHPGGAFQGGTVIAAMWLVVMMAGVRDAPAIREQWVRLALVSGPVVFVAVGLLGVLTAGAFLAYPVAFAKPLILLIEVPMLLTIALALGLLVAGPPERTAESS
jgi:multisubunit Na+/H+ antiporter MnhB subunit